MSPVLPAITPTFTRSCGVPSPISMITKKSLFHAEGKGQGNKLLEALDPALPWPSQQRRLRIPASGRQKLRSAIAHTSAVYNWLVGSEDATTQQRKHWARCRLSHKTMQHKISSMGPEDMNPNTIPQVCKCSARPRREGDSTVTHYPTFDTNSIDWLTNPMRISYKT